MAKPNADVESMHPLTAAVFAILLSLAESEKHGYAIMKKVSLPEFGSISMGPGTLYGSLDRMMRHQLIEETGEMDGQRRRYYRLTRFGSRVLAAELSRLGHAMAAARRKGFLEGAHS